MARINDIKGIYKEANKNWGSRIFALVIIAILVFVGIKAAPLFSGKSKPDCSYFEKQNQELVDFILQIKTQTQEIVAPTSFIGYETGVMFAVYDTTKKPLSKTQMQQRAGYIIWRIDSMMRQKQKMDSAHKSKS